MKRNYIILVFIILIVLGGVSLWFINKPEENNTNKDIFEENKDAIRNYGEKIYITKGEDEWYYQFLIAPSIADGDTNNFLIGCNLKYSSLDNYYVPVYSENGELIDKWPSEPTLATSQVSVNGVTAASEVMKIDAFFDENQFKREITVEDLDDLKLYHFDKNFIVDLFNNAYNTEFDKTVTKFNLSGCSIQSDTEQDGYKYNIGVMHLRRGIGVIRIDLLYSDGSYLSDLVEEGSATNEQKEIYDNFKKIEDYIVENQEVNIRDVFDLNDEVYIRLYEIIEKFDDSFE